MRSIEPTTPRAARAIRVGPLSSEAPTRCPFCHELVARSERPADSFNLEPVTCAACLAVHHEGCWRESQTCASCRGARAVERARARGAGRVGRLVKVAVALVGLLAAGVSGVVGLLLVGWFGSLALVFSWGGLPGGGVSVPNVPISAASTTAATQTRTTTTGTKTGTGSAGTGTGTGPASTPAARRDRR